ncbi:MAG: hypothetical protein ACOCRK_07310 [bacterium]
MESKLIYQVTIYYLLELKDDKVQCGKLNFDDCKKIVDYDFFMNLRKRFLKEDNILDFVFIPKKLYYKLQDTICKNDKGVQVYSFEKRYSPHR